MIRIISEGVYDTAHAVYEAKEIKKMKPDAVFLELPDDPFQDILDDYSKGKLNLKKLKSKFLKAIKAEKKEVNHELLKNFLAGQIAEEELEVLETEGRELHVIQAAKEAGAELHAMDMSLKEVETLIEREFKEEHIKNTREILETKQLPYIVWQLSDILHYPYYLIERVLRHHALVSTNPFKHNVSTCKVCKFGARWDRVVNAVFMPFFSHMPLSKGLKQDIKVAYVIRRIDYYRELCMAAKIIKVYKSLKRKLGREPKILAITHLWNAVELERLIRGLE